MTAWIRRVGFWILDFFRGGSLIKIHNEVRSVKIEDERSSQLDWILSYAKKNVPFYKEIKAQRLSDFPVMNKTIYKREGERCMSLEYPDKSKLHKVSTSGSTGVPMTVYLDKDKRQRVVVDLINAHNGIGWNLGDRFVFIRNWSVNYKQSKLKSILQNVTMVSIADFDMKKKEWLTKFLLKHPGTVLFGYASAVCDYMNYLVKNTDIDLPHPKLIVCDSDELSSTNKNKLESLFKCPVINRYDNEENGLLAITSKDSDIFTVNYQSLIIELLALDSDAPVRPGDVGRVVVTDLYNKAMPLIRYDTGDCAISLDPANKIRHLEKLCGRTTVFLTSVDGKKISSVSICAITEVFDGIERYQLIQNSKIDFVFKYSGLLDRSDILLLRERLLKTLGADALIQFENVERIEPNKNSKFSSIVNNYK